MELMHCHFIRLQYTYPGSSWIEWLRFRSEPSLPQSWHWIYRSEESSNTKTRIWCPKDQSKVFQSQTMAWIATSDVESNPSTHILLTSVDARQLWWQCVYLRHLLAFESASDGCFRSQMWGSASNNSLDVRVWGEGDGIHGYSKSCTHNLIVFPWAWPPRPQPWFQIRPEFDLIRSDLVPKNQNRKAPIHIFL